MRQLFMVLSIFLFFSVKAQSETLVFVTNEFPPYAMMAKERPVGMYVDIVCEFCKKNGILSAIKVVPWARAMSDVKTGNATGIFPAVKNKERTEFLWFPSEPLGYDKNVIMALKDDDAKISCLDDLVNKTVGVVREYSYSPEFDHHRELKKDPSVDDDMMIRKLAAGRTDFVVGDEGNLEYVGTRNNVRLKTVFVLLEDPNYFAFSKAAGEKARTLVEKYDHTIRQIRKEGLIEKFKAKYIAATQAPKRVRHSLVLGQKSEWGVPANHPCP